jgi:Zn-dependent peptidase ImmA (M78 family)
MHQNLSRFAQLVPEFNHQPLSMDLFYRVTEAHDIRVLEVPLLDTFGSTRRDEDYLFILINSLLYGTDRVITAWHEMAHVLLHPVSAEPMQSYGKFTSRDKHEREACAISVVALIPLPEIWGMTAEQIAARFRVSRRTARFRVQVYERYQL